MSNCLVEALFEGRLSNHDQPRQIGRELRRCILELLSRQGSPAELLGNDSIPGGIDALHDMGLAALLVDHCRVELPDHLVLVKLLNRLMLFARVVHVAVRRRVEHVLSHKSSSRGSRKGCRQREKQSPPSVLSRRGLSHRSRFPLKGWAGAKGPRIAGPFRKTVIVGTDQQLFASGPLLKLLYRWLVAPWPPKVQT